MANLTDQYAAACATPSDINEHLPTLHDLALRARPDHIIELGVRTGNSSLAWLAALEQLGTGHLWMVDVDPIPEHLAQHPMATAVLGDDLSAPVLAQLPTEAGIIFVDSLHTLDHTRREIATYAGRLAPGGYMAFHDTAIEQFGHDPNPWPVRRAVDEWIDHLETTGRRSQVIRWEHNSGLTIVRPGGVR